MRHFERTLLWAVILILVLGVARAATSQQLSPVPTVGGMQDAGLSPAPDSPLGAVLTGAPIVKSGDSGTTTSKSHPDCRLQPGTNFFGKARVVGDGTSMRMEAVLTFGVIPGHITFGLQKGGVFDGPYTMNDDGSKAIMTPNMAVAQVFADLYSNGGNVLRAKGKLKSSRCVFKGKVVLDTGEKVRVKAYLEAL